MSNPEKLITLATLGSDYSASWSSSTNTIVITLINVTLHNRLVTRIGALSLAVRAAAGLARERLLGRHGVLQRLRRLRPATAEQ